MIDLIIVTSILGGLIYIISAKLDYVLIKLKEFSDLNEFNQKEFKKLFDNDKLLEERIIGSINNIKDQNTDIFKNIYKEINETRSLTRLAIDEKANNLLKMEYLRLSILFHYMLQILEHNKVIKLEVEDKDAYVLKCFFSMFPEAEPFLKIKKDG